MNGFDCLLVKTSPEITLKSSSVRKYFNDKLIKNIKSALRNNSLSGTRIIKGEGRLYIYAEHEKLRKISSLLGKTFGIFAFAEAKLFSATSLSDVAASVSGVASEELKKSKTFAVRASFHNEKTFRSKDVEIEAGSMILKTLPHLKVNLSSPEKTIFAEGKKGKVFVYTSLISGVAGLPVGCQGNVAVLFDGTEDAVISAWLMLKRGCSVFPVAAKKDKKTEKQINSLVEWNAGRAFKITPLNEISGLIEKPDISVKAVVKSNAIFSKEFEREKSKFIIPTYEPLLFFPSEMKKWIWGVLQ